MKAKEFRMCYLAFKNLYGAIISDDAFNILKKYYPSLKKSEFNKDLKDRSTKATRNYMVYRTTDRKYLIADQLYDFEDVDTLFDKQTGKDYYIPDNLESFLFYADDMYWFNENADLIDSMMKFLEKYMSIEDARFLIYKMHIEITGASDYVKIVEMFCDNSGISDEKTISDFLDYLFVFSNTTRTPANKGKSASEMMDGFDEEGLKNLFACFSENLKNDIYEGKIDPVELKEHIENDLEESSIKESILTKLQEIIDDLKRYQA